MHLIVCADTLAAGVIPVRPKQLSLQTCAWLALLSQQGNLMWCRYTHVYKYEFVGLDSRHYCDEIQTSNFVTSCGQNVQSHMYSQGAIWQCLVLLPVEHENALRSLTQPCLTAYCIRCNTPMIQALYQALQISVSLKKCT